ncbi:MAG: hypothetical protein Q8M31_01670 [Beijerinckiaceae bacterium]|nr:hypothetical protein [Beijerinckiaceae bacterium]
MMAIEPSWISLIATGVIAGVTSGGVFSAIMGLILQRKSAEIQNSVKSEFERQNTIYLSKRRWKESALHELFGPIYMQLDRTRRAFERYNARNTYLEAKVLKEGNEVVRNLLLSKGHLIPPHLLEDAGRLVEHYDRWLEEFDRQRRADQPELGSTFVFAGPAGYPFPKDADDRFRAECRRLIDALVGGALDGQAPT